MVSVSGRSIRSLRVQVSLTADCGETLADIGTDGPDSIRATLVPGEMRSESSAVGNEMAAPARRGHSQPEIVADHGVPEAAAAAGRRCQLQRVDPKRVVIAPPDECDDNEAQADDSGGQHDPVNSHGTGFVVLEGVEDVQQFLVCPFLRRFACSHLLNRFGSLHFRPLNRSDFRSAWAHMAPQSWHQFGRSGNLLTRYEKTEKMI